MAKRPDRSLGQVAGIFQAATFNVPAGALVNGANAITLVTPVLSGVSEQIALLHSLGVDYRQSLANFDAPLTITPGPAATASTVYELSGAASANAWIVDARFPDRAQLVATESRALPNGKYAIRFSVAAGGTNTYLAVPAGDELSPLSITRSILKPLQNGLKYLATGPAQFASAGNMLVSAHSKEGLRGAFVDQVQFFDYYNYGRYGPDGIHRAVMAARPQYLVLMGRTNYDYHNYAGTNVDPLCPSYLVTTKFWDETQSDSEYGDFGKGFPEVAVGRIPANDAAQAAVAVSRILAHKGFAESGLTAQITADVNDPEAGDFSSNADSLVNANPKVAWTKSYAGIGGTTLADCTVAMTKAANDGTDMLFYEGHGSAGRLGAAVPGILDTTSVQAWTGNTIIIPSTCTFNWFSKDVQDYHSIAIQAMTQAGGGISASIATTTYMEAGPGIEFNKQLLANLQSANRNARWGDVLVKTQQWAGTQTSALSGWYVDLMHTECLLGDPAMPVFSVRPTAGAARTQPGRF